MIPHSKPYINKNDEKNILKQLISGMHVEGNRVKEFENSIAKYIGVNYCISSSCGTSALIMALNALYITNGDEVILPSYVCKSVADSIVAVGAIPVLCDISEEWVMTFETIEKKITKKTKAIILVHIFGINAWDKRMKRWQIPIIEDSCQALGLKEKGRKNQMQGSMAVFSFNATKCITTGEGGMLAVNNAKLYKAALKYKKRNYMSHKMTDLQASLGLSQIKKYEEMINKRKEIAKNYLKNIPSQLLRNITTVKDKTIFYRFPLTIANDVEKSIIYFAKQNIAVRRGVDVLLHRTFGLDDKDFKNSVICFNSTLSIPVYPALTMKEINIIIKTIKTYFKNE